MKGVRGERGKRQGQIECIGCVKRVHKVNNSAPNNFKATGEGGKWNMKKQDAVQRKLSSKLCRLKNK